ncbi:MAG: rhodanese-like domain-containing protein [Alphaproteobacteria bacterium]|nr:rhodanese-like domain-containing protein [Alphaproteobacteria bacterium]
MDDRVKELDPATAKAWLDKDEAILVDVREKSEFEEESIPGAHLRPLSTFNPFELPKAEGRKLILHCAIGQRSLQAAELCLAAGIGELAHLTGGIQAWKEAGLETKKRSGGGD